MLSNEDEQLQAMVNFVKNSGLDDELRVIEAKLKKGQTVTADDCRAFVRGYNGSGYAKNDYHTKLAKAVNKWAKIPDTPWSPDAAATVVVSPDLNDGKYHVEVENVQKRLDELGYPEVGSFDGKWGSKTAAALLAFQNDNDLPTDGKITPGVLAALMVAEHRKIDPARKNATMSDLRKDGAEDVAAADHTQTAGGVAVAGGALAAVGKVVDQFEGYGGLVKRVADVIDPIQGFITDNVWLLLAGVGGIVVWQTGVLKNIRLWKHQTGNDVSV
jgi:peptidoglycan hydrolase-like protein with peptidoglycan-binding domain